MKLKEIVIARREPGTRPPCDKCGEPVEDYGLSLGFRLQGRQGPQICWTCAEHTHSALVMAWRDTLATAMKWGATEGAQAR